MSRALGVACPSLVRTIEPFEYARQMLRGDTATGVGDLDRYATIDALRYGYLHRSPSRRMA